MFCSLVELTVGVEGIVSECGASAASGSGDDEVRVWWCKRDVGVRIGDGRALVPFRPGNQAALRISKSQPTPDSTFLYTLCNSFLPPSYTTEIQQK